jgi:uncharacterized protein (TIGR04255 family)
MSYRKPALTEMFARLHLEAGALPPARFFDLVPRLKVAGFGDAEFGSREMIQFNPDQALIEQASAPLVRCWYSDRKKLVQLSPDLIVMNLVGHYPGWSEFRALFDAVDQAARATLGGLPLSSLSLNTIDVLNAPSQAFRLGEYLNCDGAMLPKLYANIHQAFDISYGRGFIQVDPSNRQLRITGRLHGDFFEVRIEAGFHDVLAPTVNPVEVLERLHDESNNTFEALITDTTRNVVMQGVAVHATNG